MANTNLNTTTVRFSTGANNDQTFRTVNNDYRTLSSGLVLSGNTYSATTTQFWTNINLGLVSATVSLTAPTASPQIGDRMEVFGIGGATTSLIFDSNTFNVQTSNTATISFQKSFKYGFQYNGYTWIGSGFSA